MGLKVRGWLCDQKAERAVSNLCVWVGCWECVCEGAHGWGWVPLSAVQQCRQKQHSLRRGPSIDTVEPQTAPAGVLSIKHWTAKPKGPVNQVIWPSVDKISISANQVIFDSRSRCFGVTDKAPPQQSVHEKENWAYRASTQPKAQKSLGSHNFQLVTHPSPHRHSLSAAHDQRARLAGAFSLALLCGCLKPLFKEGRQAGPRAGLVSTSGPVRYLDTTQPSGFLAGIPLANEKKNIVIYHYLSPL